MKMMKTLTKRALGALALASLVWSAPAFAHHDDVFEVQGDHALDHVLRTIDTVPDPAMLTAAIPDVQQRLIDAARDTNRSVYQRKRALTLLSSFPDAQTFWALEGFTTDDNASIRASAYYTLGRSFGAWENPMLVQILSRGLADDDLFVKQMSVRALGWVHSEDASRLLEQLSQGGASDLQRLATYTSERRIKRIAATQTVR